jgi:hypothetical protein
MEISPKVPLFHPEVDGVLYPGRPKITKYLKLINVGDLPSESADLTQASAETFTLLQACK